MALFVVLNLILLTQKESTSVPFDIGVPFAPAVSSAYVVFTIRAAR